MKDGLTLKHVYGDTAKPKQLVVLFHGLKTDAGAMLPAVSIMLSDIIGSRKLFEPTATKPSLVLVPEAPYKMAVRKEDIPIIRKHYPSFTEDKSRAWFKIKGNNLMKLVTLKLAIMRANRFIDKQLKKYGLTDKDLVLAGYSQGGMMALYTGLARKKPCAAIVSHSGFYLGEQGGLFPARSKPPVMALMGGDDWLFNREGSHFPQHKDSVAKLREQGIEVSSVIVPELNHDYNLISMYAVSQYLNQKLHHKDPTYAKPLFNEGGDHTVHVKHTPDWLHKPGQLCGAQLTYETGNGEIIKHVVTDQQPLPRNLLRNRMQLKSVQLAAKHPACKPA